MKADTSEYWAMYYHVYLFFKNGGTLHSAINKFHRVDVVKYFYNYSKVGMQINKIFIVYLSIIKIKRL